MPTNQRTMPDHVAIIMDGNSRWAEGRGLDVGAGHRAGVENIRILLRYYAQSEMKVLTLFAFSSENWGRPPQEVSNLWGLFAEYLGSELKELLKEGVRLRFIGNRDKLSKQLCKQMLNAEQRSEKNYRGRTLVVAIDYGGRWDIANAVRDLAADVIGGDYDMDSLDEESVKHYLALGDLPDPDLCIRTGGEQRISNFVLWNLAYTELYFSDTLWPDFDVAHFEEALDVYSHRQRRFGSRG